MKNDNKVDGKTEIDAGDENLEEVYKYVGMTNFGRVSDIPATRILILRDNLILNFFLQIPATHDRRNPKLRLRTSRKSHY